jgi:SAM-dependent methyltransferase
MSIQAVKRCVCLIVPKTREKSSVSVESPYTQNYIDHYLGIDQVHPSVFALKMFLGKNPDLNLTGIDYAGKSILDVGFGDGRDLILFHQLGFNIFGVEVDETVVKHTEKKFAQAGIQTSLSFGYNDETGFPKDTFDVVFSSAALMYLRNDESNIQKTLKHVYGIVKPGGYLFGTFTRFDSHITKESSKIDENRIICKDPFYRQREGQLYWLHNSKQEAVDDLHEAGFADCNVYEYDVDWFGTRETAYMFFAVK